jgi:hypothetical protein
LVLKGNLKEKLMSNLPAVTDATFEAEVLKAPAAMVKIWGDG